MKRLLSIVLALVLVLGTLPAFAYDYNVAGKSAGQMLYDNGFIKGNNGDLMEAKKLSRAELAKILCVLYGKEKEAEAFEANHGFTDVPAGHWANPWIAYAKQEGWMKGRNEKTFDPNGTVDEKQLATVLLRVLGFETKDDEYNNAAQIFAAKTSIVLDANKAFSRGQAFDAIWPAVSTPVKADGKILGEVVGKLNPPTPDPLSIKDVQANNLKEIVVSFNHHIDKDNLGAFSLKEEPKNELSPELLEDGKTIKLTAAKTLKETKYTLVAKDALAKDLKDIKLIEANVEFKVLDNERPFVLDVKFTGPKNLAITFSEPIDASGKVLVKGDKISLSVDKVNVNKTNVVNVSLYSAPAEGKTYTVKVEGFKDMAKLENIIGEKQVEFNKDSSAPVISIGDLDQEKVVLKFSKPIKGSSLDSKLFHHTYTKYTANSVEAYDENGDLKAIDSSKNYTEVTVFFYKKDGSATANNNQPIAPGEATIIVDAETIKDLWDVKVGGTVVFKKQVTVDDVKPEVKSVKALTEEKIEVTFTKEIQCPKGKEKSFFVTNDKNDSVLKQIDIAKNKVTLTLTSKMPNKTVALKITNVTDTKINENKLDDYNTTVDIKDLSAPKISKIAFDEATTDKNGMLYVFYTEPVNDAATVASNYQYGDKNATVLERLTGNAEFFGGETDVVVIELSKEENDEIKALAANSRFVVNNVKDGQDNEILEKIKEGYDQFSDLSKVKITSAEATAFDTVVVKFNQKIEEISHESFEKIQNKDIQGIASIVGNEVVLKLKEKLETQDTDGAFKGATQVQLKANGIAVGNLTNGKSNPDTTVVKDVADKVQVEFVPVSADAAFAIDRSAAEKTITLNFSRELAGLSAEKLDAALEVKVGDNVLTKAEDEIDYTALSSSNPYAKKIVIKVKKDIDGVFVIKTKQAALLTSQGGEKKAVKPFEAKSALDLEGAKVEKVETLDASGTNVKIKITFNDKLADDAVNTIANFQLNNQNPVAGSLKFDGDSKKIVVVEFTKDTHYANNNKLVIKTNTAVKDADGNLSTADSELKIIDAAEGKWEITTK